MKTDLPIDLPTKTLSAKVSVNALKRLKRIASEHKLKIQDVISVCLLHMPEDEIVRIVSEQEASLESLKPEVRSILRKVDGMSDEDRRTLREILS